MGRNRKIGLDYFPLDVDFFQDLKIRKLIKYQGGRAVTVYALLLCNIYQNGYYMRWDEELPFVISEQTGFDEAYIREVITCCMVVGLFSKDLFDREKVITSVGIQERYREICTLIRRVCTFSDYSLISSEEKNIPSEPSEKRDISSEKIPISSEEKRISSEEKEVKGSIVKACTIAEISSERVVSSEKIPISSEEKRISSEKNPVSSENSTQIKRKENKRNISLPKSLPPIAVQLEREREIFLKFLFFEKLVVNPQTELERFVSHYASQGWVKSNGIPVRDVFSALKVWDIPDSCPKIPPKMARNWKKVYEVIESHFPAENKEIFICGIRALEVKGESVIMTGLPELGMRFAAIRKEIDADLRKIDNGREWRFRQA